MNPRTDVAARDNDGLTWRPLRRADVPALTELMAAAEAVDRTDENSDEDDVIEHYLNGLVDLDADTRLVWNGADLIGYAAVFGQRRVREAHTVWMSGTVHPTHRRRGLGRQLMVWQVDRAQQLHVQRHPNVPANLMCVAGEHNPGLAALARAEGLEEIRFWFEMVRNVHGPDSVLPPVRPVEGVRLEAFEWARDDEVREAHNVTFDGHFASTERDPAEWESYFTGSRAFRADLSLLAVEDRHPAAVAGYLLAYVYPADVAAKGRREVYIGQIGTLPAFRGRGLGSAMLATALAAWAAAGHQDVYLGVDADNATGALSLYERAGFRIDQRSTSWGRTIPAST